MKEAKNKAEKTKSGNWFHGKRRYILWALLIFGILCIISFFLTEIGVKLDWLTPVSEIGGTLAIILTIVKIIKKHRKSAKKAEIELVKPQKEHEAIDMLL